MEKKGYLYDAFNPQFLIAARRGVSSEVKQEGVRSRSVRVYQPPPIGSKDNNMAMPYLYVNLVPRNSKSLEEANKLIFVTSLSASNLFNSFS